MPLPTIQDFSRIANSALFSSRDIALDKNNEAKLGNYVFSAGKSANKAVMAAFKEALEREYGALGTHAFDTVLTSRVGLNKSLRACDVKATLSRLDTIRKQRFVNELARQLDTSPKFQRLPEKAQEAIRKSIIDDTYAGCDLASCKTPADVASMAKARIDRAIVDHQALGTLDQSKQQELGARTKVESDARPNEPTGLKNLETVMGKTDASIEDQIKRGHVGAGMRINRSETSPMLLEKLKTNGVEPGFHYRNDWSKDDTRGFMTDIHSDASRAALQALKDADPAFAAKCEGKSLRAQIMLAGRAHPAGMAAVADFAIETAAQLLKAGQTAGNHPFAQLARALDGYFGNPADVDRLAADASAPRNAALLKEVKMELFAQIRDAVMGIGPGDDFYEMSPIFRHFSERHILKLDYNEGDKFSGGDKGSAGTFRRPERILASRKPVFGPIYRFTSRQSADTINAGAVTEALANDLTRLAGVPSQELRIVRGQYTDGHPKLMLEAKFAQGYKDMEDGMLKDGRAVPPKGRDGKSGPAPESLGKYKAFFLLTADRDGVGKRGQNKGFIGGKFFAIDPGHSLEGNGKYLDISDDFSFRDTYGKSIKPRFNNFSVFDDDTRFAKLSGLLQLRETARSGAFEKLFKDYKDAFDPEEAGISDAEKAMRRKVCADIDAKKAEFDQQLARLLKIGDVQLRLYDDLADRGPAVQEKAVNTISHLEMLTSPTTWVSKHGKVALNHLEVKPETRIPWRAEAVGASIVYHCDKPLDGSTVTLLETLARNAGARYEYDNWGNSRLVVPQEAAERFFAVFSEENVQKLTHPEEYEARMAGGDPLKVARDYRPVAFKKVADPRPPLAPEQLPDTLDVPVDGVVIRIPKVHYERMATTRSSVSRPRSVDELRSMLESRIRRGNDILRALLTGNTELFRPTMDNVVALTHAVHAAALRKGEFMYRGSFSISDPDGNIARWLDKAENIYLRTSTHARPYHGLTVDGHRNMPRGLDVPEGAGGLFNGMRTFHYFTIPDANGLKDNGGSGPGRRLFLKCETFGIFCSTAHLHPFNKADSKTEGMKTRSYRPGDVLESIFHGASLLTSFFTPKEADGIRKENMLEASLEQVKIAEANLRAIGEPDLADILMAGVADKGAGFRQVLDNVAAILDNLPADENKRAEVTELLDDMVEGVLRTTGHLSGEVSQRMGNEIMIDPKDLA